MTAPRRLTDAEVAAIRRRHQPGLSPALAAEYGVHRSYIDAIARGAVRRVTVERAAPTTPLDIVRAAWAQKSAPAAAPLED